MPRSEKLKLLHQLRSELKRLWHLTPSLPTEKPIKKRQGGEEVQGSLKRQRRCGEFFEEEPPHVDFDASAVAQLMDMGYSLRHATDALLETNNDLDAAAQWLLLNCN